MMAVGGSEAMGANSRKIISIKVGNNSQCFQRDPTVLQYAIDCRNG